MKRLLKQIRDSGDNAPGCPRSVPALPTIDSGLDSGPPLGGRSGVSTRTCVTAARPVRLSARVCRDLHLRGAQLHPITDLLQRARECIDLFLELRGGRGACVLLLGDCRLKFVLLLREGGLERGYFVEGSSPINPPTTGCSPSLG